METQYFINKKQLIIYDYLNQSGYQIDDKLSSLFTFRCEFLENIDEKIKLVLSPNDYDIHIYESNKQTLNFKLIKVFVTDYQVFKLSLFNNNRIVIQSIDLTNQSHLQMINLNDYVEELKQDVNNIYQVNYSSLHNIWITSYGSGSIYINGQFFDYVEPSDPIIDTSDSITTDSFDTIYTFQNFLKIAINDKQTEMALFSYTELYIFSLPDMELITAKKIAKLQSYTKNKNYVYFNNTLIDFQEDNWQVYDTKRGKQIFDYTCLDGNQIFNELIIDVHIDLAINRLTVLDNFGSGFFVKYDTGEPYFKFAAMEAHSKWLILREENLIIIWSVQKQSVVEFYDYLTGTRVSQFYQLQSYVTFSCYYDKIKTLVLVDFKGQIIVISISKLEIIQTKNLSKVKQFACNKDDNHLYFLRTDDNIISFKDVNNLNKASILEELRPYAQSAMQILYQSNKLFLLTSTEAYPFVLIEKDFDTEELNQNLIKCMNPVMQLKIENYLTFLCQDRVYIKGIINETSWLRTYLNIQSQHQGIKFAFMDGYQVFLINLYGILLQYDLIDGQLLNTIELHSSYEPRNVIMDKNNKMLISGGSEGKIVKYNYQINRIVKIWKAQDILVLKLDLENNLLIHSSQSYLYSRNYIDSDVIQQLQTKVIAIKTLDIIDDDQDYTFNFQGKQGKILSGIYVFQDRNILVGYGDMLYFWDYLKMAKIKTIGGHHTKLITCFEFLPQINTIISAGEDSRIVLYDSRSFEFANSYIISQDCDGITYMTSTSTSYLIVGCYSGSIYSYKIEPSSRTLTDKQEDVFSTESFPITRIIVDEQKDELYIYSVKLYILEIYFQPIKTLKQLSWSGQLLTLSKALKGIWENQLSLFGIFIIQQTQNNFQNPNFQFIQAFMEISTMKEIQQQILMQLFKRQVILSNQIYFFKQQNGFLISFHKKQLQFLIYQLIHNGRIWDLKLVKSQGYVITAGDDKILQIRNYVKKEDKAISTYLGKYQFRNIVFDEYANIVIVTDTNGGIILLDYPQLFLKQEFRQNTNSLVRPVGKWQENILFTAFQFEGTVNIWNYEGLLRDTFIFESRKEVGIVNAQRNVDNSNEVYYVDVNLYMMKWNSSTGTRSVMGVLKNNEFPIKVNIYQVPSQNSIIFTDIQGIYHFKRDSLDLISYYEERCLETVTTFTSQMRRASNSSYLLFCKKEYSIIVYELYDKVNLESRWQINPPLTGDIDNIDSEFSQPLIKEVDRTTQQKINSHIDLIKIDPTSKLLFFTLPQSNSLVVFNYELKRYIYKKTDHSKIINNIIEDYNITSSRRRIITYGWDGFINIYQFDQTGKTFSLINQIYLCNPDFMGEKSLGEQATYPEYITLKTCIISSVHLAEDYLFAYSPSSFNNVKVFSYPDLNYQSCLQSPTNGYTLIIKADKSHDMIVLASSFHYIIFSYKTLKLKSNIRNLQAFPQLKIKELLILSNEFLLSQFSQNYFLINVNGTIQQFKQKNDEFDRFSFNVNAYIKEDEDKLSIQMTTANSNSLTDFLFVIKGSKQCLMEFNPRCNQHCIKQSIKNIEQFNLLSKDVYSIQNFNFVFNLLSTAIINEFPPFEFAEKTNLTYQKSQLRQQEDGESDQNIDKEFTQIPPLPQGASSKVNKGGSYMPPIPEKTVDNRSAIKICPKFAVSVSNFNSLTLAHMLIDVSNIQIEQQFRNISQLILKDIEFTQFHAPNIRYFIFDNIKYIKFEKILLQKQVIKKCLVFNLQSFEKAEILDVSILSSPAIFKSSIFEITFVPQNISTMAKEFYLDGFTFYNNTYFDGSSSFILIQTSKTTIKNVNITNNSLSNFMKSSIFQLQINKLAYLQDLIFSDNKGIIFLISQFHFENRYSNLLETTTIFEDELHIKSIQINKNYNDFDDSNIIYILSNNLTITDFNATSNESQQGAVLLFDNTKGSLQNFKFEDNQSVLYSNLIITNSVIKITSSNFTSNKGYSGGVTYILKSEIYFSESYAYNNEATDGGVMYIKDSSKNSRITQVEFKENSSSGSGGCIVLDNSDVDLSENNFILNRAEIGGAIRYINLQPAFMRNTKMRNLEEFSRTQQKDYDSCGTYTKNRCEDNTGRLFGNNIGSYVNKIVQVEKEGEKQKFTEQKDFQDKLFKGIRSGQSEKKIIFQLLDEFNQKVDFSNLDVSTISPALAEELKQFTTKLEKGVAKVKSYDESIQKVIQQPPQNIQIDGNVLLDYFSGEFVFDQYSIEGIPNTETIVRLDVNPVHILNPQTYQFQRGESIYLNVTFRSCQIGEIPLKSCPNCSTISCQECPQGTYSLEDPSLATACMKCDYKTSLSCQKNIIKLRPGYWRESNTTDKIHYCSNFPSSCNGNEQTNYCAPGYIGPLCETCDYEGAIQGIRYGKQSLGSNHIDSCQKCENLKSQYAYFALSILGIIVFVFLTIYEINCQQVNKVILNLIHRSGMQVMGKSAFQGSYKTQLTKLFIHHLLILSTLQSFHFDISFLDWFQQILSPFMFMNSSLDCILYDISKGVLPLHYSRLLYFNLLILFLLLVTFIAFKITYWILGSKKKNKSEMISLQAYLNSKNALISLLIAFTFIFQQDIIYSLFTVSSCRKIGSEFYISNHLIEKCYTKTYYTYTLSIVLPFLFIWAVLLPGIVYYKIDQFKKKSPVFTNSMRQVGFMTCDYKVQHSHWELFKIYIRITIVSILCFLESNSFRKGFYISIILMGYLQQLQSKKPYLQKEFQESDQHCTIIEIFIMWLLVYNETSDNDYEKQIITVIIICLSSYIAAFLLGKVLREIIMSYLQNSFNSNIKGFINNWMDHFGDQIGKKYPSVKSFFKENLSSIYSIIYLRSKRTKKMQNWKHLRKQYLDFKRRKQEDQNATFYSNQNQLSNSLIKSDSTSTVSPYSQNKNEYTDSQKTITYSIQTHEALDTNQLKPKQVQLRISYLKTHLEKKRRFDSQTDYLDENNSPQIEKSENEKEEKLIVFEESSQQLEDQYGSDQSRQNQLSPQTPNQ